MADVPPLPRPEDGEDREALVRDLDLDPERTALLLEALHEFPDAWRILRAQSGLRALARDHAGVTDPEALRRLEGEHEGAPMARTYRLRLALVEGHLRDLRDLGLDYDHRKGQVKVPPGEPSPPELLYTRMVAALRAAALRSSPKLANRELRDLLGPVLSPIFGEDRGTGSKALRNALYTAPDPPGPLL